MKRFQGYILVASLLAAPLAHAAAPWFMIISGPQLKERLVLQQPLDFRFEEAFPARNGVDVAPEALKGRPRIGFDMYWGEQWRKFLHDGGDPRNVREDQANEHCWFYPAFQSMPALVEMGDIEDEGRTGAVPPRYRLVDEEGLKTLQEFGVPVKAQPER